MLKKYSQFSFAFAIVFFVELIAVINDLRELQYFTKPLITFSLMFFIRYIVKRRGRFANKVIKGLFFSLIGDVLLMFTHIHEFYFLGGLVAFSIAHLFYMAAFYIDSSSAIKIDRKRYILPTFMVFGFFCLSYYYLLQPYLGQMRIPVLVYSFIITLMGITAALRYGRTNLKSFNWVLMGAIFFIISDAILAYNKFVERLEIGELLVMATYMVAQYLIAMGTAIRKYMKKGLVR